MRFSSTATVAVVCLLAAIRTGNAAAMPPFTDFAKSLTDAAGGIFSSLPDVLPNPNTLFSASKNLLVGYPAEAVISAVHLFCSSAISASSVQPHSTPAIDAMNFVLMTRTHNVSIPLREADRLWHHAQFNASRPTVVLVTGWTSNINKSNSALSLVYEAFMCRGGVNFVAIDTAEFVDTLYEWAAFNTEEIGNILAAALNDLTTFYPLDRIHLIGHSLGAHIVGSAGRNYQTLSGKQLPQVTGLDPANPCFSQGQTLTGLSRGDAHFVDVIHSNPGALGKRDSLGDVDFYPNGLDPLPPGCLTITCAHSRAYEYYAESVYPGNENVFAAVKCPSLFALNAGFCKGRKVPMGYATPTNVKGDYFLKTDGESPFGKNSHKPADVRCNNEDGTPATATVTTTARTTATADE